MYYGNIAFGGGTAVKQLAILAIALVLLLALGCTSNDRVGAGTAGRPTTPTSASAAAPSGAAAPISQPSDPGANGGASLPAAAPYSQPGSASAQQNVNPTPFLTASQGAGAGGARFAPATMLTSRADGTMAGPNDQPAATTGWGTSAPPAAPTAEGGKTTAGKRGAASPK